MLLMILNQYGRINFSYFGKLIQLILIDVYEIEFRYIFDIVLQMKIKFQIIGKEYLKFVNSFLNELENIKGKRRKFVVRIVDQRNLVEEIKLIFYKERSRGRVKGFSIIEQKFRLMIAREKSVISSIKFDVLVY